MTTELKPCPFCGGKAVSWVHRSDDHERYGYVSCEDCPAETKGKVLHWGDNTDAELSSQFEAALAWNTRAVPELVRYDLKCHGSHGEDAYIGKVEDGEYVRYDQAAAVIAAKDKKANSQDNKILFLIARAEAAEAKNTELEAAWLNAEGKISDLEHKLAQIEKQEPVAVVRFDRSGGNENEMPKVVSCNWLPDGSYPLYAVPVASEAETISWLKSIIQNIADGLYHKDDVVLVCKNALSGKEAS